MDVDFRCVSVACSDGIRSSYNLVPGNICSGVGAEGYDALNLAFE